MILNYTYQVLALCVFSFGVMAEEEIRSSRIIGGTDVSAGTYPWFARATQDSGQSWSGCGGSLISAEYVLSAAHCIIPELSEEWTGFQIGALCDPYIAGNNCGQAVEYFDVLSNTRHPNYDQGSQSNDFVLVRLNGSSSITPVDIDSANISTSYANGKDNLWAIGLGSTNPIPDNAVYPTHLQHVELKYITNQACCTTPYEWTCSEIGTNNMCAAGDPGEDGCVGDSGGPLYDSTNQKLVGVTSFGGSAEEGCAAATNPGVWARIGDQMDWIKSVVCNNHSANTLPSWCPAPAPCVDSIAQMRIDTMNMDNIPFFCKWVNKGQGSTCSDNGILESHCPKSCGKCAAYGCLDSTANFVVGGSETTCASLSASDPALMNVLCKKKKRVRTSCRATCGYCGINPDLPPTTQPVPSSNPTYLYG